MSKAWKDKFMEGQIVVYKNPATYDCEIGKIKRLCDDGAFVWYHMGETAAKTRYEDLYPISNEHCITRVALGGPWSKHEEGEG